MLRRSQRPSALVLRPSGTGGLALLMQGSEQTLAGEGAVGIVMTALSSDVVNPMNTPWFGGN